MYHTLTFNKIFSSYIVPPKEMLLSISIGTFLTNYDVTWRSRPTLQGSRVIQRDKLATLAWRNGGVGTTKKTMTSQIESFNTISYTTLYKNEQFESSIIQGRLLILHRCWPIFCTQQLGEEHAILAWGVQVKCRFLKLLYCNNLPFILTTDLFIRDRVIRPKPDDWINKNRMT